MKRLILIAAALLGCAAMQAKITLPSVISDNMVLQQNTEASLWGTADPGAKVTIKTGWSKQKTVVTADAVTGKWLVKVATPAAGGPYEISISDSQTVTLRNVLIGEVWFCSGQSNMEMPVKGYGSQPAQGGTEAIVKARASRPIRICNIKRCSSKTELDTSEGSWKEHTSEAVANISATAYFFADALQEAIDVPVGIIVSAWGGSSIETWMNRETIERDFGKEFDLGHLDGTRTKYHEYHDPCLLFNGQVAPIVPYTFKGMIWYQGEQNRPKPDQYVRLQTAYVAMMRELFQVPDAPFYFVQIAPYHYSHPEQYHNGYFNEAQQKTLATIPHSGMVTTLDIGDIQCIHPAQKREVGQRLAWLALRHDYGQTAIEPDAPTYKSVEFKDGHAFVTFNVDGLGLSPIGRILGGFEMAGEDKVFHPAKAKQYKGHIIEVWSDEVTAPVAVRYCFRNGSEGTVFNNFGIPAAPFRTDDWSIKDCK